MSFVWSISALLSVSKCPFGIVGAYNMTKIDTCNQTIFLTDTYLFKMSNESLSFPGCHSILGKLQMTTSGLYLSEFNFNLSKSESSQFSHNLLISDADFKDFKLSESIIRSKHVACLQCVNKLRHFGSLYRDKYFREICNLSSHHNQNFFYVSENHMVFPVGPCEQLNSLNVKFYYY